MRSNNVSVLDTFASTCEPETLVPIQCSFLWCSTWAPTSFLDPRSLVLATMEVAGGGFLFSYASGKSSRGLPPGSPPPVFSFCKSGFEPTSIWKWLCCGNKRGHLFLFHRLLTLNSYIKGGLLMQIAEKFIFLIRTYQNVCNVFLKFCGRSLIFSKITPCDSRIDTLTHP